jgi:hypothetical protein
VARYHRRVVHPVHARALVKWFALCISTVVHGLTSS